MPVLLMLELTQAVQMPVPQILEPLMPAPLTQVVTQGSMLALTPGSQMVEMIQVLMTQALRKMTQVMTQVQLMQPWSMPAMTQARLMRVSPSSRSESPVGVRPAALSAGSALCCCCCCDADWYSDAHAQGEDRSREAVRSSRAESEF